MGLEPGTTRRPLRRAVRSPDICARSRLRRTADQLSEQKAAGWRAWQLAAARSQAFSVEASTARRHSVEVRQEQSQAEAELTSTVTLLMRRENLRRSFQHWLGTLPPTAHAARRRSGTSFALDSQRAVPTEVRRVGGSCGLAEQRAAVAPGHSAAHTNRPSDTRCRLHALQVVSTVVSNETSSAPLSVGGGEGVVGCGDAANGAAAAAAAVASEVVKAAEAAEGRGGEAEAAVGGAVVGDDVAAVARRLLLEAATAGAEVEVGAEAAAAAAAEATTEAVAAATATEVAEVEAHEAEVAAEMEAAAALAGAVAVAEEATEAAVAAHDASPFGTLGSGMLSSSSSCADSVGAVSSGAGSVGASSQATQLAEAVDLVPLTPSSTSTPKASTPMRTPLYSTPLCTTPLELHRQAATPHEMMANLERGLQAQRGSTAAPMLDRTRASAHAGVPALTLAGAPLTRAPPRAWATGGAVASSPARSTARAQPRRPHAISLRSRRSSRAGAAAAGRRPAGGGGGYLCEPFGGGRGGGRRGGGGERGGTLAGAKLLDD